MPVPRIAVRAEARRHLGNGIHAIADLLSPTLGPVGGVVANQPNVGQKTELLNDSSTAVRRIIEMGTPDTDVGAMFMRGMIWQVGQEIGDGGTVAAILTRTLFDESQRLIAAGESPIVLANGIRAATEDVVAYLKQSAQPVEDENQLTHVARGIIDDSDLAQVLGEMSYMLGPEAHVNVHKFVAPYLQQYYHPGGHYKAQIASMHFYTDKANRKTVMPTGRMALVDKRLDDPVDIIAILQAAQQAGAESLTILANHFSDQIIGILMANNRPPDMADFDESALEKKDTKAKQQGKIPISAAQMKFVGEERRLAYLDLELLTGSTIVGSDIAKPVEDITADDLGIVFRSEVDRDSMYVQAAHQFGPETQARVRELQTQLAEMPLDHDDYEMTVRRVSALTGGVGQIKIGADAKVERELLAELTKRTVTVLSTAQRGGVLPGAAASYAHARTSVDLDSNPEWRTGKQVLLRSLPAPLEQIVRNAYVENTKVYLERIVDAGPRTTFDAVQGKVVDAFEHSIFDVAETMVRVLQTAVSNAIMAITTDTIVYHKEPEQSFTPNE